MKQDRVPLTKPIPVKLPPEVLQRVDAVSKLIGEPRSTVMRMAMRVGLEALEKAFSANPAELAQLVARTTRYPNPNPPSSSSKPSQGKSRKSSTMDKIAEIVEKEFPLPPPK